MKTLVVIGLLLLLVYCGVQAFGTSPRPQMVQVPVQVETPKQEYVLEVTETIIEEEVEDDD